MMLSVPMLPGVVAPTCLAMLLCMLVSVLLSTGLAYKGWFCHEGEINPTQKRARSLQKPFSLLFRSLSGWEGRSSAVLVSLRVSTAMLAGDPMGQKDVMWTCSSWKNDSTPLSSVFSSPKCFSPLLQIPGPAFLPEAV